MPPPITKLNTLVGHNGKVVVDPISKFFITFEFFFGFDRIRIFGDANYDKLYRYMAIIFCLIMNCVVIYLVTIKEGNESAIYLCFNAFGNTFCIICSFVKWEQLNLFYKELNKFDMVTGGGPKVVPGSIRNLILMSISFIWIIAIFIILLIHYLTFYIEFSMDYVYFELVLLCTRIVHTLELHYYGHLFNLLISELRFINRCVESLSESNIKTRPRTVEEGKPNIKIKNLQMNKLIDLYYYITTAYDFSVAAIKWQLLTTIVSAFTIALWVCYGIAQKLIINKIPWPSVILDLITTTVKIFPLFSPCVFGDRLHGEVLRLRELIASKLYENHLDKVGRNSARTLLALTETRDLSFALLRILNIDISFPFKFIGLLITYLIILLQFEKVMNPD